MDVHPGPVGNRTSRNSFGFNHHPRPLSGIDFTQRSRQRTIGNFACIMAEIAKTAARAAPGFRLGKKEIFL
jgi:hypothetical protein